MGKLIDLVGFRFEQLVVLERAENNTNGDDCWLCRCDCGTSKIIRGSSLRREHAQSCGCWKQVCSLIHGHSNGGGVRKSSPTYSSFTAMKVRCLNPKSNRYSSYGGAGVTITSRWLGENGFQNFLADLGERPPGTTLGRFGDVGNYELGNCKWMTSAEQVANHRPDRARGWSKKKVTEQIAA